MGICSRGVFSDVHTVLIDPEEEFNAGNIAIHGIYPSLIKSEEARTFPEVWPQIRSYLEEFPVVSYNAENSMTSLREARARYGLASSKARYINPAEIAREQLWPGELDGINHVARKLKVELHTDPAGEVAMTSEIFTRELMLLKWDMKDVTFHVYDDRAQA